MNGGAFRVFLLILATTVGLWADGVVPAVTTNAITTVTNAVSITTNSPSVTTNTVLVPEVIKFTNAPPSASQHESLPRWKQEIPANLGAFSVIPATILADRAGTGASRRCSAQNCGVPQLAGISTLRGNQQYSAHQSSARRKAEYVFCRRRGCRWRLQKLILVRDWWKCSAQTDVSTGANKGIQ